MPIPLPDLDDRSFDDLVAEMRALIPRYAPSWTDHNASDPGITLVELFAWLGEALIYRINRIPQASEVRFLELLGVRFQPAQAASVVLRASAANLAAPLSIPAGSVVIGRPAGGGASLRFETLTELALTPAAPAATVQARQTTLVSGERLGYSTGGENLSFTLGRPHLAAVPAPALPAQPAFQPLTLRVLIDNRAWTYRPHLLDSGPADEHFSAAPHLNLIYFGSGVLGKRPPAGALIQASYRSTQGAAANDGPERSYRFERDPGAPLQIEALAPPGGGADPTSLESARRSATSLLRKRHRAVTAADFEQVVLEEPGLGLARAKCLPEWNVEQPEGDPTGHVSVIIVPAAAGSSRPAPGGGLIERVWQLLDGRRLITSRHHVSGPIYVDVHVRAEVVHERAASAPAVREAIIAHLAAFFHPLTGGPGDQDGGWPFGRDVYASEVYEVIENTPGVDHVETLTLWWRQGLDPIWRQAPATSPAPGSARISLPAHGLVHYISASGLAEEAIVVRGEPGSGKEGSR